MTILLKTIHLPLSFLQTSMIVNQTHVKMAQLVSMESILILVNAQMDIVETTVKLVCSKSHGQHNIIPLCYLLIIN